MLQTVRRQGGNACGTEKGQAMARRRLEMIQEILFLVIWIGGGLGGFFYLTFGEDWKIEYSIGFSFWVPLAVAIFCSWAIDGLAGEPTRAEQFKRWRANKSKANEA